MTNKYLLRYNDALSFCYNSDLAVDCSADAINTSLVTLSPFFFPDITTVTRDWWSLLSFVDLIYYTLREIYIVNLNLAFRITKGLQKFIRR